MYVLPVAITFVSVATVVVALRIYTRLRLIRTPGWDDWFLLLALATDYAFFGIILTEHAHGMGKPVSSLSPNEFRMQIKMLYFSVPMYNLTLNLTKISMVILYMRLFTTRKYRIFLIILLILVVASGLYMVLGTLLICVPVQAFWYQQYEHCVSRPLVWCLTAAMQIVSDLVIVAAPMPQLISLRVPPRQKICLMAIFALGLFVCATGVARLHSLVMLIKSEDRSRHNGFVTTWSFVESNVALVCASLPTFRQLIIRAFPRMIPSSSRSPHSHRTEKHLPHSSSLWKPYAGRGSYSADISANMDQESVEHIGSGIQVQQELRWEFGDIEQEQMSAGDGCGAEWEDIDLPRMPSF
ncbi:uncharacterized protein BDV14DRAFT_211525 [Aspergillus stella-maris]|uniref:uncharacterized protein n=1 Tax=Aspergillus stella-maris TaxID=1810926 RepID=UPI003CCE4C2D